MPDYDPREYDYPEAVEEALCEECGSTQKEGHLKTCGRGSPHWRPPYHSAANLSAPEPAPIQNSHTPSWELVMQDMRERHESGIKKYGTPLQPMNGRNSLVDAYQEVLDLAVYLRNEIEEQRIRREKDNA